MSSLYEQVLPRLRPFQREAVEFAISGKQYERQFNADETNTTTSGGGSISKKQNTNVYTDPSLLGKGRLLLADEMGLGKTLSSLAIMAYYESQWPLLIICPASLRYTWPAEIEKFLPSIPPQSVYIAAGFQDIGFTKRRDVKIVIITYSLIQNRSAVAHALEDHDYHCIIVDESHNLKQRDSQRSKILLPLLRKADRLVLLSGTPALARPCELWTQASVLAPKVFGSWSKYANHYCDPKRKSFGGGRFVMDYNGSSNQLELHSLLKNVMVRRLKANVLHELPPKQRTIVPVSISSDQKSTCAQAMTDLKESRESIAELWGDEARRADFQAKGKLMAVYQSSGVGKAKSVAEYLLDWLSGSLPHQKILVFAHHKMVLDTIDQALLEKLPNSHIRIDGSVPTVVRAQLVRKFQTCDRVRVALLSMTAAGVGLTLTAASTVLFAELHWTPGILAQCEDRAHRIGQTSDSVQILYMVCKDKKYSVDMSLWEMLAKKIGTLDQVVDGKEDVPYLFNALEQNDGLPYQGPGKSVQDELANFFAGTSMDDTVRKKRLPAKGSIESFFKKLPKNSIQPSIGVATSTPSIQPIPSTYRKDTSSRKSANSAETQWQCQKCPSIQSSSSLHCQACGHQQRSATAATAPKTPSSNDNSWVPKATTGASRAGFLAGGARVTSSSKPCPSAGKRDQSDDSDLDDYFYTPVFGRSSIPNSIANKTEASSSTKGRRRSSVTELHSQDRAVPSRSHQGRKQIHWTCRLCTLENLKEESTSNVYPCEACGEYYSPSLDDSKNDSHGRGSQDSVPQNHVSQPPNDSDDESECREDNGKWSCSTCTLDNSQSEYACQGCGADYRPGPSRATTTTARANNEHVYKTPRTGRKQEPLSAKVSETSHMARRNKRVSAASEIIVIDDEDASHQSKKAAARIGPPEVIEINSDDDDNDCNSSEEDETRLKPSVVETGGAARLARTIVPMSFSVSKNSGRIFVHLGKDLESTGVSFDVEQVVTAATADRMLNAQATKRNNSSKPLSIDFDPSGTANVCRQVLESCTLGSHVHLDVLMSELKSFVIGYLKLRQVEKKAVKEAGRPVEASELPQHVARLLVPTSKGTDRYTGGAKERARERVDEGNATDSDLAILEGWACAWCGKLLSRASRAAESTYCSQACAEEGRLRRGGMYSSVQIRAAMFALEGGKCTLCGIDCHALFEQIRALEPPQRLNKLLSANWKLPKTAKALEKLLQNPKEGDFWQVDHITAVAEGGGGCGLENLRTLCVPCHAGETEKLRGRLRLASPNRSTGNGDPSKRKQPSISNFFESTKKTKT